MVKFPHVSRLACEAAGIARVNTIPTNALDGGHLLKYRSVNFPAGGTSASTTWRTWFISQQYDCDASEMVGTGDESVYTILNFIDIALRTLHDANVVHCDVKPQNFFCNDAITEVVLGDFGSCVAQGEAVCYRSRLYTVHEWLDDAAHIRMDWAALILSGLTFVGRYPADVFDDSYPTFLQVQNAVIHLENDDMPQSVAMIRQLHETHFQGIL